MAAFLKVTLMGTNELLKLDVVALPFEILGSLNKKTLSQYGSQQPILEHF